MSSPIEMMLDGIQWRAVEPAAMEDDGLPWVTHDGVLNLFGNDLKCYRLSDGKAVFEKESFEAFLQNWFGTGDD